jgi:hypothetical protein
MPIKLYPYQEEAKDELESGSILCGGVGSGKSLTALSFYLELYSEKPLYIITTARKRDTLEWHKECAKGSLTTEGGKLIIDSWNKIKEYANVENAFFIFDEQRVVGSGSWAKTFVKIAKKNDWILLTATPGDTWSDYIPVFVANGFYKNRTAFVRRHILYSRYAKFPKVERYLDTQHLVDLKNRVLVYMDREREIHKVHTVIFSEYDKEAYKIIARDRWNPFENKPVRDAGAMCYLLRKVSNTGEDRLVKLQSLLGRHPKSIIFYNFNYELDALRTLKDVTIAEYNGHKHEPIPSTDRWVYLVQYMSGAEGWNCVETDTVIFYSPNYSYKMVEQAAGRIDRLNTPFNRLYYYTFRTKSGIDYAIELAQKEKKVFNERRFVSSRSIHSV